MQPYPPLYSYQKKILELIAQGKNIFALLPTGSGKTLCYELPAALWGWRVLVVSPLLALIEDQVLAMKSRGLSVARVHSGLSSSERNQEFAKIQSGEAKLVFLSPELLLRWEENGTLASIHPKFALLAMDELHCAVDWQEFRSSYLVLGKVLSRISKNLIFLGLSASLGLKEAGDLFHSWGMKMESLVLPLGRAELIQLIVPVETRAEKLLFLVACLRELHAPRSAIIYCASRQMTEILRDQLLACSIDAVAFHAGLPTQERLQRVKDFRAGRLRVVCASSAFGLGIDYPFVDRVILWGIPYDWSSYWQEIGRAGRNGEPAVGIVLWSRSDALRFPMLSPWQWQRAKTLWSAFSRESCRKVSLAEYFGLAQLPCGACDVCWRKQEFSLPKFLPDPYYWLGRKLWWLENRADTLAWLDEFFPSSRKNLDGIPVHDSV